MTAELTRPPSVGDVPAVVTPVEPAAPTGPTGRTTVDRLLDSLDDLVRRHRALATSDAGAASLHAELIAAELDQQLDVLRRLPRQAFG
ncbi:hypothetical protein WIS52_22255 [Pseudonocardia nematodicida]|uniref:Uncharacterized protein n=1 Tax=Pseudonocardia nematodicida TaxID=1206997 RepID=A0ABV1KFF4_9PSEU